MGHAATWMGPGTAYKVSDTTLGIFCDKAEYASPSQVLLVRLDIARMRRGMHVSGEVELHHASLVA